MCAKLEQFYQCLNQKWSIKRWLTSFVVLYLISYLRETDYITIVRLFFSAVIIFGIVAEINHHLIVKKK